MAGPFRFAGYRDVLNMSTKASKAAQEVRNAEGVIVKWCAEEEGALLPRQIAVDLARFIRDRLKTGEAFPARTPGLSNKWQRSKQRMGLDERMGFATGQMAEEVKAIRAGKGTGGGGTYSVGISSRARTKERFVTNEFGQREKIGSIQEVWRYAALLEYGSSDGKQPARPWFFPSVLVYFNDKLPDVIRNTLMSDLEPVLSRLAQTTSAQQPDMQPEDFYKWATGEMPEGKQFPSARTVGETFGQTEPEDVEGYQITETRTEVDTEAKGSQIDFDEKRGVYVSKVGDTIRSYFDMETQRWENIGKLRKKKK